MRQDQEEEEEEGVGESNLRQPGFYLLSKFLLIQLNLPLFSALVYVCVPFIIQRCPLSSLYDILISSSVLCNKRKQGCGGNKRDVTCKTASAPSSDYMHVTAL